MNPEIKLAIGTGDSPVESKTNQAPKLGFVDLVNKSSALKPGGNKFSSCEVGCFDPCDRDPCFDPCDRDPCFDPCDRDPCFDPR